MRIFQSNSFFPSLKKITIDISFTSIILFQPENHAIMKSIHILVAQNHCKKILERMENPNLLGRSGRRFRNKF